MTCCPSRFGPSAPARSAKEGLARDATDAVPDDAVRLPGGRTTVGTNDSILPRDGEKPARVVRVRPFAIDRAAVTVARFRDFVAATGYQTEAERYGWSFVFHGFLRDPDRHAPLPRADWWRAVDGATWAHPEGPHSNTDGREDHPVTHVSHTDALAFAAWAGGRLPTEAEWEHAAQGGLNGAKFPWGDVEPDDTDHLPCNIWQGRFPISNTGADGYLGTAPARSYAPNGYGLFNMVGNAWEWTSDPFRIRSLSKAAKAVRAAVAGETRFVVKGGSYLCHRSYCYRYRIAARSSNTPDSTTGHTGFRLAYSVAG